MHAEALLGAARSQAEPRDDLVEDEQRARRVTQLAQALEKARLGRYDTHVRGHGLDDDAGHLAGVLGKQALDALEVVIGGEQGVGRHGRGHARRVGHTTGEGARAGLDEHAVDVAVVAALELDDLVPARRRAREAQGAHDGLGAGVHEAHHLQARHHAAHEPGEVSLTSHGRSEGQSARGGRDHGLANRGVVVPQDERAPRVDVVHVVVAVDVDDVRPLATSDERRLKTHALVGANRAVDAPGKHLASLGEQAMRCLVGEAHYPILPSAMAPAMRLA